MATNVKQSPIPVVPRTMKIVNADGTITRSGQQLLEQLQAPSATAGTHGDRPNPGDVPEGSLWYENDRGVLYASTLGVWQYVAGTMFGTLSPDERPTDLGTHDAGFDFRGTDQPREFLWSQTEWIEVTEVQYGTHAARPGPATIVEGALYVESDRGGVIYQRETPAGTPLWQYLAGTMWGTLSPDQRPTGLGTHDAGFDFRTTTAPPREFIWNQTAWVEVTPVSGAVNLTHPNAVTRVGSTQGQIVEGGIIDASAAGSGAIQIDASGKVGIGTAPAVGLDVVASQIQFTGTGYTANLITLRFSAASAAAYAGVDSAGNFQWSNSGGSVIAQFLANGHIAFPFLPSGNPGAGTKQLYYDPADANRVKFAP